jgi:hypothetical protein
VLPLCVCVVWCWCGVAKEQKNEGEPTLKGLQTNGRDRALLFSASPRKEKNNRSSRQNILHSSLRDQSTLSYCNPLNRSELWFSQRRGRTRVMGERGMNLLANAAAWYRLAYREGLRGFGEELLRAGLGLGSFSVRLR